MYLMKAKVHGKRREGEEQVVCMRQIKKPSGKKRNQKAVDGEEESL